MASYTDTVPTFNPYVKQLPVDAMVQVGMYKQQKYDEGIQKIQTNIDNIAGLDVVRDVDKAYLQSKLNQLGNHLSTVAAGDFSNFQLVNSVNGMTNQIAKDPNVLNALASAKAYRKGLEDMDAANKAGKGSASNDWLFKTDASNWLNSQELDKTFNSGYKQYTDYKKNAQEVIKGLVKNETGKDVAFEYDKNGNMIVLDAMTRTKISGITPERIQAALMVGLSPNDWQQMQIDGRYNYSNSTPEQFVSDVNKSYETDYNKYKTQRDTIANAMDSTNSLDVKRKLQSQVDSLDKELSRISKEYQNVTKTFAQGDVESAKARLHTTKWVNEFAQTFASQEVSQTYETSPFQQVKQFKETKQIEYDKWLQTFNQTERFHRDSEYWKGREDKRAEAKEKREAAEAAGYGGVHFSVPQDELPEVTLQRIVDGVKEDQTSIAASDAQIMKDFKKEGNEKWLNQQYFRWQNSPGSVDPLLAAHFKSTEETRREIAANQAMIVDISSKMDQKYGKIEDYIPAGSKSVTVKFPSGSYTYSPSDFVHFNSHVNRYVKVNVSGGTGGAAASVTYDDAKAKAELSPKEYYLYQAYKNQSGSAQKLLVNNMQHYNTVVNQPFRKVIDAKEKETAEIVQQRVVAMQGMEYGIPLNNEAQKTTMGNALQAWADLADSQSGKLPYSPTLDTAKLRAIAGDLQNANIRVVEGTRWAPATYEITAADKKGNTQTFRVPAEDYQSVFGGRFDADPAIQAIRPYEMQMIRTGSNTTALDGGKTNIGNSFIGNTLSFPNVNYYGVSGNLVKSQSTGLYSVRINITDPISKQVIVEDLGYPSGGLMEGNKVDAALQGLTDSKIFQMIYGRMPSTKELQSIQKASQNPY